MEAKSIRLNKYLSEAGVCSRREADRLIEAGHVRVDGETATVGMRIAPSQAVLCDGKPVHKTGKLILLMVNKPRGIVCTTSDKDRAPNIVDYIHYPTRIYPVGRLDKDSEGLILMTNEGDLVNKMMRAGNAHEKEYVVTVDRLVTEAFLKHMKEGVAILDTVTRPCVVEAINTKTFRIILTQGLNRQIRRMCEALGYQVKNLRRIRIMNLHLGDLKTGDYRAVNEQERQELMQLIKHSTNQPYKGTQNGH